MNREIQYGVALPAGFDGSVRSAIDDAAAAGFVAVSLTWKESDPDAVIADAAYARQAGLAVSSVHAPWENRAGNSLNDFWQDSAGAKEFWQTLSCCIAAAGRAGIPVMVLHPMLTSHAPPPTEAGARYFAQLGEEAARLGVKIAIENLELCAHLEYLLAHLRQDVFGFCWDTGHSFAFTPQIDWIRAAKGRILMVHLHDNEGKKRIGLPDTADDCHYLPFDGNIDWQDAMRRLAESGYRGTLTLEVKRGRAACPQRP